MNSPRSLAGIALCFILSTGHAQTRTTGAPPSVVGGKATNLSVYNYTGKTMSPFWVTPAGQLQTLPNASPVPPIGSNGKPLVISTFVGATVVFKPQTGKGGSKWVHLTGARSSPFIILGTPPPGANVPTSGKATPPPTTTAAAAATPASKGKGKAPNVNVVVIPPPGSTTSTPSSASATPAPAKTASPILPADDPQVLDFLRTHNEARAALNLHPLKWSDTLARSAQERAAEYARDGRLDQPDATHGESISDGRRGHTPAKAATEWLAEKAQFDPAMEKYTGTKMLKNKDGQPVEAKSPAPGAHYAQMVWRKTKSVGFGFVKRKDGKVFIVAHYDPRGNRDGEKAY